MGFLLDVIHDETNLHRNVQGKEAQQPPEPSKTGLSVLQTAAQFWQNHLQFNQSIIDRYWRLLEVTEVKCRECSTRTFTFSPWFCLMLPITEPTTMEAAIRKKCSPELISDFHCNHCRRATASDRSEYYARFPPLVCVVLNRFNSPTSYSSTSKCTSRVTWDFNNLDLTPYFLSPSDRSQQGVGAGQQISDRAFTGPFHYECYAVLIHVGGTVNSGHYYTYVRDQGTHDPYSWYCCNDERVSKVRIGSGGPEDVRESVFKTGADAVPYMAFFRRKGGR
jgi:ubiquitin carboxyl-terminal hydrolase 8